MNMEHAVLLLLCDIFEGDVEGAKQRRKIHTEKCSKFPNFFFFNKFHLHSCCVFAAMLYLLFVVCWQHESAVKPFHSAPEATSGEHSTKRDFSSVCFRLVYAADE